MKAKKLFVGISILFAMSFQSCNRIEPNEIPETKNLRSKSVFDLMLAASTSQDLVNIMHEEAKASLSVGLEESVYFEEILSGDSIETRSSSDRDILRSFLLNNVVSTRAGNDVYNLNEVEIYWPYCDEWDGVSQPVIVLNTNEPSIYFDGDKVMAYRLVNDTVETVVVDENYAEQNPVWVINKSDVTINDIINLKLGNYDNTNYLPAEKPLTRSSESDYISRARITSLKSITQHDDWLNGGSEYVIYWFFPSVFDKTGSVESNICGQIKMSRKEIKQGTVRELNFLANDDWTEEQLYNKLKVIEFDPGANLDVDIDLKGSYKGFEGELKTKITLNKTDEMIMEDVLTRKARFAEDLNDGENVFREEFNGGGVTITSVFRSVKVTKPF